MVKWLTIIIVALVVVGVGMFLEKTDPNPRRGEI